MPRVLLCDPTRFCAIRRQRRGVTRGRYRETLLRCFGDFNSVIYDRRQPDLTRVLPSRFARFGIVLGCRCNFPYPSVYRRFLFDLLVFGPTNLLYYFRASMFDARESNGSRFIRSPLFFRRRFTILRLHRLTNGMRASTNANLMAIINISMREFRSYFAFTFECGLAVVQRGGRAIPAVLSGASVCLLFKVFRNVIRRVTRGLNRNFPIRRYSSIFFANVVNRFLTLLPRQRTRSVRGVLRRHVSFLVVRK